MLKSANRNDRKVNLAIALFEARSIFPNRTIKKVPMFEAIANRRTCRKFDPAKPIARETLQTLATAAVSAPTGVNQQSYDIYVVTKQDILNKVATASAEALKGKLPFEVLPQNVFYGAPAVIFIVPARKEYPACVKYDQGIIANAICLAGQALGVASAIIGCATACPPAAFKEALGLPNETAALGIALGYPTADWKYAPKELTTQVRWLD
jgi:nitroreductase